MQALFCMSHRSSDPFYSSFRHKLREERTKNSDLRRTARFEHNKILLANLVILRKLFFF